MKIEELSRLFDGMYRENRRMWEAVQSLRYEQLTQPLEGSSGSIRAQLVRMIRAENLWVNFLWHGEIEFLREDQYPTLALIRVEWDALEAEIRDYLSTLTSADLERTIKPPFLRRAPIRIGDVLVQVVSDAANQRAHILTGLQKLCSERYLNTAYWANRRVETTFM